MTSDPSFTEGKFVHGASTEVLAYRMSIVETELSGINGKLDQFIARYPSSEVLELILGPMRNDIRELKEEISTEKSDKQKNATQMKYLIYAAILGPVGTFIITVILASAFGVTN